jgi:UDP-N-acetylglucosamine 2-epimerase (non-hydrolysing)
MKILVSMGTRPEIVKLAPVVMKLREHGGFAVRILLTAQHRELSDQMLEHFDLHPDIDLDVMRRDQTLAALTARLIEGVDRVLVDEQPRAVLVQGDTTTVLATSLASFYRGIPVGHVEAGLRTGDLRNPFPEEANRALTARLARWHFAPTPRARANLIAEGLSNPSIHVTGNTVIDALLWTVQHREAPLGVLLPPHRWLVVVTLHRRESFGAPMRGILEALRQLAREHADLAILLPVHPNPNVHALVHEALSGVPNVVLCEPLSYGQMVAVLRSARLVLTDSGGLQEEAPALGKPVLVLRDETERPEGIEAGVARLVGTNPQRIVAEAQRLLLDEEAYRSMSSAGSPYGDGHAAERITAILAQDLLG